jgi:hypothetical protein
MQRRDRHIAMLSFPSTPWRAKAAATDFKERYCNSFVVLMRVVPLFHWLDRAWN